MLFRSSGLWTPPPAPASPLASNLVLQITTGGALGTAAFQYSLTGGAPWTTGVLTAASVVLGASGLTAAFPAGTYSVGNQYVGQGIPTAASVLLGTTGMTALLPALPYDPSDVYAAAPPVPEIILGWLTAFVTDAVATRHGINPNDPLYKRITDLVTKSEEQLQQAANSKDGLWDLPQVEDLGSAVNTGGPRGYSESSPYQWTYGQQARAMRGFPYAGGACCAACGAFPCVCRNGLVGG